MNKLLQFGAKDMNKRKPEEGDAEKLQEFILSSDDTAAQFEEILESYEDFAKLKKLIEHIPTKTEKEIDDAKKENNKANDFLLINLADKYLKYEPNDEELLEWINSSKTNNCPGAVELYKQNGDTKMVILGVEDKICGIGNAHIDDFYKNGDYDYAGWYKKVKDLLDNPDDKEIVVEIRWACRHNEVTNGQAIPQVNRLVRPPSKESFNLLQNAIYDNKEKIVRVILEQVRKRGNHTIESILHNARDTEGRSALDLAANLGYRGMVELLMEYYEPDEVKTYLKQKNSFSALHHAIANNRKEIVEYFMNYAIGNDLVLAFMESQHQMAYLGDDLTKVKSRTMLPLDVAAFYARNEILKMIFKKFSTMEHHKKLEKSLVAHLEDALNFIGKSLSNFEEDYDESYQNASYPRNEETCYVLNTLPKIFENRNEKKAREQVDSDFVPDILCPKGNKMARYRSRLAFKCTHCTTGEDKIKFETKSNTKCSKNCAFAVDQKIRTNKAVRAILDDDIKVFEKKSQGTITELVGDSSSVMFKDEDGKEYSKLMKNAEFDCEKCIIAQQHKDLQGYEIEYLDEASTWQTGWGSEFSSEKSTWTIQPKCKSCDEDPDCEECGDVEGVAGFYKKPIDVIYTYDNVRSASNILYACTCCELENGCTYTLCSNCAVKTIEEDQTKEENDHDIFKQLVPDYSTTEDSFDDATPRPRSGQIYSGQNGKEELESSQEAGEVSTQDGEEKLLSDSELQELKKAIEVQTFRVCFSDENKERDDTTRSNATAAFKLIDSIDTTEQITLTRKNILSGMLMKPKGITQIKYSKFSVHKSESEEENYIQLHNSDPDNKDLFIEIKETKEEAWIKYLKHMELIELTSEE